MEQMLALCARSWDDVMYPIIGAIAVLIVGVFVLLRGGSKLGWLFIVGAIVWAYTTMEPVMHASRRSSVGQSSATPYLNVPKQK